MRNKRSFIFSLFFILLLLVLEIAPITYSEDATLNGMIDIILTRLVGCLAFLPLVNKRFWGLVKKNRMRTLLFTLVPFCVVVNNFPFIGLISGNATLDSPPRYILIFALQALSIGLFEEFAFRGAIFPVILEKRRGSAKQIFIATVLSSALFGGVHLLNLFAGGSLPSVLLQVGYSFLIGGMCAIVLLHTRCIWICVFLHAVFDFGGLIVPTLGAGKIWDVATVTITAVIGVAALVFMLVWLSRVTPDLVDELYSSADGEHTKED